METYLVDLLRDLLRVTSEFAAQMKQAETTHRLNVQRYANSFQHYVDVCSNDFEQIVKHRPAARPVPPASPSNPPE